MKLFLRANTENFFGCLIFISIIDFLIIVGNFSSGNVIAGFIALLIFLIILASLIYLIWFQWFENHYKRCPSCQKPVVKDKRHCTDCGFDISPICPVCDTVADPKAKFCSCGAAIKRSPPITAASKITTLHSGTNTALHCSRCNTSIEPKGAFCGGCGEALEPTQIIEQE